MKNDNAPLNLKAKTVQSLMKKGKLRGSVDAKCAEYKYDLIGDGSWRLQVENCTSFGCQLYLVRPTTIKVKGAAKKKPPPLPTKIKKTALITAKQISLMNKARVKFHLNWIK